MMEFSPSSATRFPIRLITISAIAFGMTACDPGEDPGIQVQERDSAGITIVESSTMPERGSGGWILDQTPTVSIGSLDGDPQYQLYQVYSGLRLPGGQILIADGGSLEIRIYDAEGEYLRSFGRPGEGPGEFQSLTITGLLGPDTIVAMDGSQRRISLIHLEEGFIRATKVEEEVGPAFVSNGMFSDGSVVFGGGLTFGGGGDAPTDGAQRQVVSYRSSTLDGTLASDFGTFPGSEYFMRSQGGAGGSMMISAMILPFGKRPAARALGNRIVIGSADSYEFQEFDSAGELIRIIRVNLDPTPVTPEALATLIDEQVADLDDPTRASEVRNSFREYPIPEFAPAYQGIILDSEGFTWVQDFKMPGVQFKTWTLFDLEGRPTTRLSLPADNRILEIGPDYVLARYTDQLEIEYVRVYNLTRGR